MVPVCVSVGINVGFLTRVVGVLLVGDRWVSVVAENRISFEQIEIKNRTGNVVFRVLLVFEVFFVSSVLESGERRRKKMEATNKKQTNATICGSVSFIERNNVALVSHSLNARIRSAFNPKPTPPRRCHSSSSNKESNTSATSPLVSVAFGNKRPFQNNGWRNKIVNIHSLNNQPNANAGEAGGKECKEKISSWMRCG